MNNFEEENDLQVFDDEKDLLIDEEFDGIQELNNPAPRWIMALFFITIFWGAMYWVHFHTYKQGVLQDEEYANEVAAFESKRPVSQFDENNIVLLSDGGSLDEGKTLFTSKNCHTCHGVNGEGHVVGPNLTDNYWIHGGDANSVFKTIKYGVIEKGMTPFSNQMSDSDIQKLTSYILNKLVGSDPPNAKEAQGEKM